MVEKNLNTFSNNSIHDLKKIMVSKQIRRLKGKKQVFSLIEPPSNVKYDYVHERLLHTIEVESIANEIINRICDYKYKVKIDDKIIAIKLRFSQSLLDSVSYAHDFGHTPFGHVGETALTDYMHGNNMSLSNHKRVLNSKKYMPIFKHNYYSAALLYRNFVGCNADIIDGVLKHSSISRFNGEVVKNVYDFGSNSYLPPASRNKKNYLHNENAYTLEGQVVAIADEVAQMLSDIEVSKIALQESFVRGIIKNAILTNNTNTLKEYLASLRNYFLNEIVDFSKIQIQSYLNRNYKKGMIYIRFYERVVYFGSEAENSFKELEDLRSKFLHGNEMVKVQNALSYLIIYRIFDYYLEDIKNLFKNDRKTIDYISENFTRIRDGSNYKKQKKTNNNKYEAFLNYIKSFNNDNNITHCLNSLFIPNKYILKTIDQNVENDLAKLCNYVINYFLNNYGENELLDALSRSLLREISFSIAKMTDRYAINLFYKTFGKHFIKCKIHNYICNSCKNDIATKQFELNKSYKKRIKRRLLFLKKGC